MIETVHMSIDGKRGIIEELYERLCDAGEISHYPAQSAIHITLRADNPQYTIIRKYEKEHGLDVLCRNEWEASSEELATSEFFSLSKFRWIESEENLIDTPIFTEDNVCPDCGRGAYLAKETLVGELDRGLIGHHVLWLEPSILIISTQLAKSLQAHHFTGAEIRPILGRRSGEPSEDFSHLQITSILPKLDRRAGIERYRTIPNACETCHRLGYRLPGAWQLIYKRSDLAGANSWNLTTQWFGASYTTRPHVVCPRNVVHRVNEIDPNVKWIPVKILDD